MLSLINQNINNLIFEYHLFLFSNGKNCHENWNYVLNLSELFISIVFFFNTSVFIQKANNDSKIFQDQDVCSWWKLLPR